MADSPKLRQLAELQARQEAILSGMQDARAEYPTTGGELDQAAHDATDYGPSPEYPTDEELARGPASLEGFKPATSNEYEYKDPNAPGAAPGRQGGPMAQELKGLPGVVEPGPDGYDRVNSDRLSLHNASATGELARKDAKKDAEIEKLNARLDALLEGTRNPETAERAAYSGRY